MDNVLLVTVDSLRADHLGCYGYGRPTSPRIDSLAEDAHRFGNAFANAQATRFSFPAIMTSTYPLMYGGYERLSGEQTVLAAPLSEAGYRTGGFHSNVFLSSSFGYGQGFDVYEDSESSPTVASRLREWVKDNLDQDGLVFRTLKTAFDMTEKHAGIEIGSSYVTADEKTDRAVEFVREGPAEGNFLWVHYMDVHHPYVPPERHQATFRDEPVSSSESIRLRRKMLKAPESVTDEEFRTIIDLYDAEIRFMDDELGRLLDVVDEEWTDAMVVFTADHGEAFREHGEFSHGTLYEEGIHVPLLIDVGESSGATHDELVGLIDVPPTILDYAGAPLPDSYRGNSLRPVIEDGHPVREYLIGEAGYDDGTPRLYYRDQQWKYIRDGSGGRLFDLEADPDESTDVASAHPDVLAEIEDVLDDHLAAVEATDEQLESVEVSAEMERRLEALGYKE